MNETLLSTETDRLNSTIKIFFVNGHNVPRKVSYFILSNWAELIDSGHCNPNYVPTLLNKKIIYITREDKVIASIMWTIDNNSAFIDFTVVDKDNQRLGLYGTLHKYFNQINTKFNIKVIRSQLHSNNIGIIEAAKQQGYSIEYYKMIKEV